MTPGCRFRVLAAMATLMWMVAWPAIARAEVKTFFDRQSWNAAVTNPVTIDFEVPAVPFPLLILSPPGFPTTAGVTFSVDPRSSGLMFLVNASFYGTPSQVLSSQISLTGLDGFSVVGLPSPTVAIALDFDTLRCLLSCLPGETVTFSLKSGDTVVDTFTEQSVSVPAIGFVGVTSTKAFTSLTITISGTPGVPNGVLNIDNFSFASTISPPAPPSLVASVLPASRAVQIGATATAFANIINNTVVSTATAVGIAMVTPIPVTFSYQTTDPATNLVTGTPNTPVTLPPGEAQTFLISLTPTASFGPTDVAFNFAGSNTAPAPTITGVNTLLLSASTTPVPDIVALAVTPSNDGIVTVPGPDGTGVFAVATVNVGAGGTITASTDTGTASLPLSIALCQTNPSTAQCVSPIGPTVTTQINANDTPTFAIFVRGLGTVPFDPANNRVFVRFKDASGATLGATSVAVKTN